MRKELDLYSWVDTGDDRERNNMKKPIDRHNHLIYCVETACALRFPWVPDFEPARNSRFKVETPEQIVDRAAREAWFEGERVYSGNLEAT